MSAPGHVNERLVFLLRGCVRIVQAHGLETYAEHCAVWLGQQGATGFECAWLGPRLMGYAQGMSWGYIEGANDVGKMFTFGEDDLAMRRN